MFIENLDNYKVSPCFVKEDNDFVLVSSNYDNILLNNGDTRMNSLFGEIIDKFESLADYKLSRYYYHQIYNNIESSMMKTCKKSAKDLRKEINKATYDFFAQSKFFNKEKLDKCAYEIHSLKTAEDCLDNNQSFFRSLFGALL